MVAKLDNLAGAVSADAVTAYLSGGRPPNGDTSFAKMSLSQLRDRVAADAAAVEKQRAEAAEAAERTARKVAEQKAKAELQRREMEVELKSQRKRELAARVERQAAERMLRDAELRSEVRSESGGAARGDL